MRHSSAIGVAITDVLSGVPVVPGVPVVSGAPPVVGARPMVVAPVEETDVELSGIDAAAEVGSMVAWTIARI
jgi:hypothetical protein